MRSSCLVILIVVLNAIVAVQPSNAAAMSDFQASRRDSANEQYKRLLQSLISEDVVGQQREYEDSQGQVDEQIEKRAHSAVWNKLQGQGGLNVQNCKFMYSVEGKSVAQCQYLCQFITGCNAIDIDKNGHCTFRGCDEQKPSLDSDTKYNSYIIHHTDNHWNKLHGQGGLNVAACPFMKSVEGKSVEQCQQACEFTSGCDAIDINKGGHCTFRTCDEQKPLLDSDKTFNSYIIQHTPAHWNKLPGKGGLNVNSCPFIKSVEKQSLSQCQYLCEVTSGCNAIDINKDGHCTFRECTEQKPSLDSDKSFKSYIMKYKPAHWKPFHGHGGLNVADCRFMNSVEGKSVEQCQYACEFTSGCDAIDINKNGHCTFRACDVQKPPLDSDKSFNSYIIHRSPVWKKLHGKGGLNVGSCPILHSVKVKSVAECKEKCESISDCDAIDINSNGHCTFRGCKEQNPKLDSDKSFDSYIMQGLGGGK